MKFLLPLVILASALLAGCATPPLCTAVAKGDKAAVDTLLKQGAKVSQTDSHDRTPLILAAETGQVDIAEILLAHGANPTNRVFFHNGDTAFHAAAQSGKDDIIRLFLSKGVKVNTPNRSGQTALMLAAWSRQPETVALLLDRGADPNLTDSLGWTALHSAWKKQSGDQDAYERIVRLLLDHKAKVNVRSRVPYGYTPLMSACALGDVTVVELMLKAGANPNTHDENGNTPYSIAAQRHDQAVKSMLVEHGVKETSRYEAASPPIFE